MVTSKDAAVGRAVAGAYPAGSAKQDPATGAIAVRTNVPYEAPGYADRAWGVMTLGNGGHYQDEESVLQWPDLVTDPAWVPPVLDVEDGLPESDSE